jgi:cysteine desulfurase
MREIYLDNNATTAMDRRVIDSLTPILSEVYGNPSSIHRFGQASKKVLEEARDTICGLLGIKNRELVYTSCGSESNNLAIKGVAKAMSAKGKHLITSKIEHSSVIKTMEALEMEGYEVSYVGVDEKGRVNLQELEKAVREDTILISIMHSNNEIGTIQPIKNISKIAKKNDIIFHVDAVQSIGKMKVDVDELGIDLMSFAAHKFYGPKGVGGLYIKDGITVEKLINGGFQERNRRAGTENIVSIHGMAKAMELAYFNLYHEWEREKELRDYLEKQVLESLDGVSVNGDTENRLCNTSSLSVEGVGAEELLFMLDMNGVAVSAGSACASGSLKPSHVLEAIGLDEKIGRSTLRISVGRFISLEDVDYFLEVFKTVVERGRRLASL